MSPTVVDASALLSWLLGDNLGAASRFDEALRGAAGDRPLVAPSLLAAEVANGLLVAHRRARITAAQAQRAAVLAQGAPVRLETVALSIPQLLALASVHQLSAYDAQYLELAMRMGAGLLTADAALGDAARRAGVALVG